RAHPLPGGLGPAAAVAAHDRGRARPLPVEPLPPLPDHRVPGHDLALLRVDDVDRAVGAEDQRLTVRAAGQRAEAVAGAEVDQPQLARTGVDQGDLLGPLQLGVRVLRVVAEHDRRVAGARLVADPPVPVGALDLGDLPVAVDEDAVLAADDHGLPLGGGLAVHAGAVLAPGDLLAVAVEDEDAFPFL